MIIVTRRIKQIQYLGSIYRYFNSSVDETPYCLPAICRRRTAFSTTGNVLDIRPQTTNCPLEFHKRFRRPTTASVILGPSWLCQCRFFSINSVDGREAVYNMAANHNAEKRKTTDVTIPWLNRGRNRFYGSRNRHKRVGWEEYFKECVKTNKSRTK